MSDSFQQVRSIAQTAIADANLTNDTPLGEMMAVVRRVQARVEAEFAPDPGEALLALRDALDQIGAEQGLFLPRLRVARVPSGPEPLRDANWARNARAAFELAAALGLALDERRRAGGPDLPVLILASAILNGLLMRPEAWVALLDALRDGTLRLHEGRALPQLPWIRLALPGQKGRPVHDAETGEDFRFFPDVQTLALLKRWHSKEAVPVPEARTPQAALDLVVSVLCPDGMTDRPKAAEFARAACAPFEDRAHVALPYALTAVASGDLIALSLDDASWALLHDPGRARPLVAETGRGGGRPRKAAPAGVAEPGILWRALTVDNDRASPRIGKVRAALQALDSASLAPVGEALRLWYLFLLARQRKVSSVQTYHSAIAGPLLALVGEDDPAGWSPDELEDLVYLAARGGTGNREAYRIARLAQFLSFASRDRRLGWAQVTELGGGSGTEDIVRTAHFGPDRAGALLAGFPAHLPHRDAAACQVAFLLAWRGGLRLAEIAGLKLTDVLDGETGSICVHNHAATRLKSEAGRRLVPLRAMLADHRELDIFDRFLARRRREGGELFLTEGFDKDQFRALLAQLGGIWPHGLRHAALSNLSLVLFGPPGAAADIARITGWSVPGQARLRALFLGERPDPRRAAPQLARLAGHADPATTFRHYLHFSDVMLGLIVRFRGDGLSPEQVRRRLGLNVRTCPDGPDTISPEVFRTHLLSGFERERISGAPPEIPFVVRAAQVLTPDLALRILGQIEAGHETSDLASDHGLAQARIEALARTAKALMARKTGRGRALIPSPSGALVPHLPRQAEERKAACDIAARVLADPEPQVWAEVVLAHSDPDRPGLRLRRPDEARSILAPLKGLVGTLCVTLPAGRSGIEDRWRAALAGTAVTCEIDPRPRGTPPAAFGRAKLKLWHAGARPRRTAQPSLRLAAFLVLAMGDGSARAGRP